ncbi:MAG: hypothetical protein ACK48U_20025, partial [Planctomyces sp.]
MLRCVGNIIGVEANEQCVRLIAEAFLDEEIPVFQWPGSTEATIDEADLRACFREKLLQQVRESFIGFDTRAFCEG